MRFPQWVSLPHHWDLQDVQAVINITIDILSALGIFIFVRICWQRAAQKVAKAEHVALPSLLSINTPGDAFDILVLLKQQLFSFRFAAILAQCLVVIALSGLAIASGPLARYSCRGSTTERSAYVPGRLASRTMSSIYAFNVQWSNTRDRLSKAGFPLDQLLDFAPDPTVDWVYRESEWNNSWSLACTKTQETPLSLRTTSNCSDINTNVAGLETAFDLQEWEYWNWDFTDNASGDVEQDVILFFYGYLGRDWNKTAYTEQRFDMAIAEVHLHNARSNKTDSTGACPFVAGAVGSAAFTRVECSVSRRQHVPNAFDVAYPDVDQSDSSYITTAFGLSHNSRLMQQSVDGSPLVLLDPDELIRFYQSYLIVKDTVYQRPVHRMITIVGQVVQVSTIFLAAASLAALLIILGALGLGIFSLRHRHAARSTPQTKLDWMMQSIQGQGRSPYDSKGRPRWSVSTDPGIALSSMRSTKRRRSEFSIAKYSSHSTSYSPVPQYPYANLSPQISRTVSNQDDSYTSPTPLARFPSHSVRSTPSFSSDQYDSRSHIGLGIEEDEQPLVRPSQGYRPPIFSEASPEPYESKGIFAGN